MLVKSSMLDSLPIPLWQIVAAVVGLYVGLKLIKKIMSGGKSDQYVSGQCSCGWKGQMSKYRPICPRCGTKVNVQ
jgi:hypothetical protein